MKLGISTYSCVNLIESGRMSVTDVMEFYASLGASHVELVPFGFTLYDDARGEFNEPLIASIRARAESLGLEISDYAVLGDLLKPDKEARKAEMERLCRHIDVAEKLGIKQMRHDVSSFRRPLETNTPLDFEKEFPVMAECCAGLADYAARGSITTMVENHGFFVNGADRVIRLAAAVGRENFGLLADVGNFACVDEDCAVAVKKVLPFAKMIHLKDFYIRKTSELPELGGLFRCDSGNWFSSNSGRYMLRGAILGQGDLDESAIFAAIRESGFSGYGSLEFEGMESPESGCAEGLRAAQYFCGR